MDMQLTLTVTTFDLVWSGLLAAVLTLLYYWLYRRTHQGIIKVNSQEQIKLPSPASHHSPFLKDTQPFTSEFPSPASRIPTPNKHLNFSEDSDDDIIGGIRENTENSGVLGDDSGVVLEENLFYKEDMTTQLDLTDSPVRQTTFEEDGMAEAKAFDGRGFDVEDGTLKATMVNANDEEPEEESSFIRVPKEYQLSYQELAEYTMVFFDLRTVSKFDLAYVSQLSAVALEKGTENCALDTTDIPMFCRSHIVPGATQEALKGLMTWISTLPSPIILVGHDIRNANCQILLSSLRQAHFVKTLATVAVGFVDLLPFFKEYLPNQVHARPSELKVEVLKKVYVADNAHAGVAVLQNLFDHVSPSPKDLQPFSLTMEYMMQIEEKRSSLKPLLEEGVITPYMARKMANAGVTPPDLQEQYERGGAKALQRYLSYPVEVNTPRVTKHKRVIDKIIHYYENSS